MSMCALLPTIRLPPTSSTVTTGCTGPRGAAGAALGDVRKASFAGAPVVTAKGALVSMAVGTAGDGRAQPVALAGAVDGAAAEGRDPVAAGVDGAVGAVQCRARGADARGQRQRDGGRGGVAADVQHLHDRRRAEGGAACCGLGRGGEDQLVDGACADGEGRAGRAGGAGGGAQGVGADLVDGAAAERSQPARRRHGVGRAGEARAVGVLQREGDGCGGSDARAVHDPYDRLGRQCRATRSAARLGREADARPLRPRRPRRGR